MISISSLKSARIGELMCARKIAAILSQTLVLTFLLWTSPALGEPLAGTMEVRGTVGYSNFLDEGPLHHLVTGGSARFYVTNRVAIEPEFLFMYRSRQDIDLHFIPNVVFDFTKRESRFQPYAIGGVGLERHRELTGIGILLVQQLDGLGRDWDEDFPQRSSLCRPRISSGAGAHSADHWKYRICVLDRRKSGEEQWEGLQNRYSGAERRLESYPMRPDGITPWPILP